MRITFIGAADTISSPLEGPSGHADRAATIDGLRTLPEALRRVCAVHGEPHASDALRLHIRDEPGWPARVTQHGETAQA